MNEYVKLKKCEFYNNVRFCDAIKVKIAGVEPVKKFKKEFYKISKSEYKMFEKITIKGFDNNKLVINPNKDKLKNIKNIIDEADVRKMKSVIFVVSMDFTSMEQDDVKIVFKFIKSLCKNYDAVIKYNSMM